MSATVKITGRDLHIEVYGGKGDSLDEVLSAAHEACQFLDEPAKSKPTHMTFSGSFVPMHIEPTTLADLGLGTGFAMPSEPE